MAVSEDDPVLLQRVLRPDGTMLLNLFNTGDRAVEHLISWRDGGMATPLAIEEDGIALRATPDGVFVALRPHQSRLFRCRPS